MALSLDAPLTELQGIGPKRSAALAEGGLQTVEDLLWHLPTRWEDRRRRVSLPEVRPGGPLRLAGVLTRLSSRRTPGRRRSLVEAEIEDAGARLRVVWFQQPYLRDRLRLGVRYELFGRVREAPGGGLEMSHPEWWEEGAAERGGLVAVYPPVAGLSSRQLRGLLREAIEELDPGEPADTLPPECRRRHRLPLLGRALRHLHAPPDDADLELLSGRRSPAHLRLIYGELFEMQERLAEERRRARRPKAHRYRVDDRVRRRARELLPFALTAAQRRAVGELVADLRAPLPMRRLLQGDVGSGKTVVAALLLLVAAASGVQCAYMAPTEILAQQQHATLCRLLGQLCRLGLVTSSSGSEEVREALAGGTVEVAVGTHALFQEGVRFRRLGLVVIDEQHRFGVAQRERLASKGNRADVLVMSATPIPRSLALSLYGDLDVTVIDELPPGRRPVLTEVLPWTSRRTVRERLVAALERGERGFLVFPVIDSEEGRRVASLQGLGARWRRDLERWGVGVVHGRQAAEEREEVLEAFRRGALRVLLATTVVEVGVDVPEATAMVIESAERFGLAQLHQLRGRVGRGMRPGWCAALHGPLTPPARRRLDTFAGCQDGFAIAEADLAQRGPGELLGERQAGLPRFRVADLATDLEWLVRAHRDARRLAAAG